MDADRAAIAVPLLNSYAHQYLGLRQIDVTVAGAERGGKWFLLVARGNRVFEVNDFDAAKELIDEIAPPQKGE